LTGANIIAPATRTACEIQHPHAAHRGSGVLRPNEFRRLARKAQKWKPVLRQKARWNYGPIIGRDSRIALHELGKRLKDLRKQRIYRHLFHARA
jgi:hypothetical protein